MLEGKGDAMSVQRTITMSEAFWQRIINAPGDVPLDKNGDPVMPQQKYAQNWMFDAIKKAVIKAEHVKASNALVNQPVIEDDFVIE
jgi:hypothetical protein